MSRGNGQQVKIVFIDTYYIETDVASFKYVVQRLTGKDSVLGTEPMCGGSAPKRRAAEPSGVSERAVGSSVLFRGVSFKEFDELLVELPPLDELLS